jgi:hypothetical protein
MDKFEKKLVVWYLLDLPLTKHITVVDKILAVGHSYYSSSLFPSKSSCKGLEPVLRNFLLGKQGVETGMSLVVWNICTLLDSQGRLELLDVQT